MLTAAALPLRSTPSQKIADAVFMTGDSVLGLPKLARNLKDLGAQAHFSVSEILLGKSPSQ
jgi:hypothetical protein